MVIGQCLSCNNRGIADVHLADSPQRRVDPLQLETDDLGVEAADTVFIDNMERNTKAAEELGIKGVFFTDIEKLKTDLEELGIEA